MSLSGRDDHGQGNPQIEPIFERQNLKFGKP